MRLLGEIWDDLKAEKANEIAQHALNVGGLEGQIASFFNAYNAADVARTQADAEVVKFTRIVGDLDDQVVQMEGELVSLNE